MRGSHTQEARASPLPNSHSLADALFKQATVGDVQGKRPGALDLRGRAKYDAWSARSGQSKDEAKQGYIEAIAAL